jgi:DNA-binding transcriptional LysR family regulator
VQPTAAGQVLLERARSALLELEHLSAELSDHASGIVGVIRPAPPRCRAGLHEETELPGRRLYAMPPR